MDKWMVFGTYCFINYYFYGTLKANGVFLQDIVLQYNASHTMVGWALALQGFGFMIAPISVKLLDVFSYRQLLITGGFLVGLGYLVCGFSQQFVWMLYGGFILTGIGSGLYRPIIYMALKEHFQDEFPTAMSVISIFDFVGVATLPPLLQFFKGQYGLFSVFSLIGAVGWNLAACGITIKHTRFYKRTSRHSNQENNGDHVTNIETSNGCDCFAPFYLHITLNILASLQMCAFYVYTSWALFLFSLGTTLGLSNDESVLLSTAGGIGGLFGKCLGIVLFYTENMNSYTSSIIPLLTTGSSLLICIFVKNFYVIASLIFLSGFSQGTLSSGLDGLFPSVVCQHHFRSAAATVFCLSGIAIQLGGFISGFIRDVMGSTIYVYIFNAILCFIMVPVTFIWTCDKRPVEDHYPQ